GRLELEASELAAELEKARAQRQMAAEALRRAQDGLDAARVARAARESELASARIEHEWRSRDVRTREQEVAAMTARLHSLEEIDTHRSGFADAAKMVLVNANGKVGQMGALADFLEVEPKYERAVEACLGDLLQHVVVERLDHVSAGLKLIRQENAGRCGFIVGRPDDGSAVATYSGDGGGSFVATSNDVVGAHFSAPAGAVALTSVVRIGGPFPQAVQAVMGGAMIAESFEAASRIAPTVPYPVATLEGDVFRGRHVVTGGDKAESRGILATKREIKELREKLADAKAALEQLVSDTAGFEQTIALATAAIAGLSAEFHRQEKAIVGVEGQSERAADDELRVQQRTELVQTEVSRVREEVAGLDARQAEARESIARLNEQRVEADQTLSESQRKLYEARETAEGLSQKAAEARAAHAGLIERSAGA
ncbi:MAG: hypothetical protein Q8N52_07030, partial [Acidobacteriota bacterium]|nr:hypothetical protein [Acidobacteriota bacterium]